MEIIREGKPGAVGGSGRRVRCGASLGCREVTRGVFGRGSGVPRGAAPGKRSWGGRVHMRGQECLELMGLKVRRWGSREEAWAGVVVAGGKLTAGSCVPRRRASPVVPHPAREDRASSSRERSTSRGRGAARSSSRESGRGGRGRGRPARTSPSPSGLCQPRPAGGRRWDGRERGRHDPVTPASSLHTSPLLGGRLPRFDPTAFVKAKEKKLREIKMK